MKKYILILAAVLSFAACDNSEEPLAPFDDLIAGFDIAKMDQAQLVDALTSSFIVEVEAMHRFPSSSDWTAEVDGYQSHRYLFNLDGSGWVCYDNSLALGLHIPYHMAFCWVYNANKGEIQLFYEGLSEIGDTLKVLYYKGDCLITEEGSIQNGKTWASRLKYKLYFDDELRKSKAEFHKTTWDEVLERFYEGRTY